MTFKKLTGKIHLWLGLASGLVVFIVGITGCCYVFINEIQYFTEPWQFVQAENKPYLPPSQVKGIVEKRMGGKEVSFVNYSPGYTSYAGVFGKDYSYGVYVNPYNGNIQHVRNFKEKRFDFFGFVLDGHMNLWLPFKIGRPIENACILIFLVLLISGLVLWWPRNWRKANRDKSFKIKWKAKFKRINYDLHNVLGFYALLIAFAFTVTGLVWSYQWFARSVYWISSAGSEAYPEFKAATSDTTISASYKLASIDSLWIQHTEGKQGIGSFVSFPKEKQGTIEIGINYRPGTNYKQDFYDYDRYTLKPVKGRGVFSGKYVDASVANRIARMNYDIHTGQIGGLPTKILAFFASFICASLPITGFYIWWGKTKKKPKKSIKQLNKGKLPISAVIKETMG